ncbi:FHA domain-containing protein [Candidatus Latescibacterota bacterium]
MDENWNIILSVLESPDNSIIGQQKVFTTSPISIGRSEDSDFVLLDPSVSRNHATLRITNDFSRVFIIDNSTHGTTVSGKPVPKGLGSGFTIRDGENIKIGDTLLRFEINLKQSVQATFIGNIDRDFLDKPPAEQAQQAVKQPEVEVNNVSAPIVEMKSTLSPFYIGVIIVCILILVYLMFFQ